MPRNNYSVERSVRPQDRAASMYSRLESFRRLMLNTAYDQAEMIFPAALRRYYYATGDPLPQPYSTEPHQGITHMASRFTLQALPLTVSAFRLSVDPVTMQVISGDEDAEQKMNAQLGLFTRQILRKIEHLAIREETAAEAMYQATAFGTSMISFHKNGDHRPYSMDEFVFDEDRVGNLLLIIIKETVSWRTLDQRTREYLLSVNEEFQKLEEEANDDDDKDEPAEDGVDSDNIDIYTVVDRVTTTSGDSKIVKFREHVEAGGYRLPWSVKFHTEESLPYIILRFQRIKKQKWGAGLAHTHGALILQLNLFAQILAEGSAAANKFMTRVDESLGGDADAYMDAAFGGTVPGAQGAYEAIKAAAGGDLSLANERYEALKAEFRHITHQWEARDSDRTTAEEISASRQESGKSQLAQGAPMVRTLMKRLVPLLIDHLYYEGQGPVIPLPDGKGSVKKYRIGSKLIQAEFISGLFELGIESEQQRVFQILKGMAEVGGPNAVPSAVKINKTLRVLFEDWAIDPKKYGVMDDDEIAQKAHEQQMAELQQRAVGPATSAALSPTQ